MGHGEGERRTSQLNYERTTDAVRELRHGVTRRQRLRQPNGVREMDRCGTDWRDRGSEA